MTDIYRPTGHQTYTIQDFITFIISKYGGVTLEKTDHLIVVSDKGTHDLDPFQPG